MKKRNFLAAALASVVAACHPVMAEPKKANRIHAIVMGTTDRAERLRFAAQGLLRDHAQLGLVPAALVCCTQRIFLPTQEVLWEFHLEMRPCAAAPDLEVMTAWLSDAAAYYGI